MQPPDPLDEWISPPFEPTVRGDNLYARGASDDKGQTYILIKAVESLLRDTGRLPVNVRFLIEGEEETGGEHIEALCRQQTAAAQGRRRGDLRHRNVCAGAADAVRRTARHCLWRTARARGRITTCIPASTAAPRRIRFRRSPRFSARLKDRDGHILIPGFYDRVQSAQREGARSMGAASVR